MITEISTPESWKPWLTAYLKRESTSARPVTTRKLRSYHIRRFAVTVDCTPDAVTLDDILDHIDNPDWSAGYRRSVLGSLRSFFRWARRAGRITVDPAEDAPSIRVELTKPRPATSEAVDAGLTADDPRVRLMTRLANEAGMRCCEIARVNTADVVGRPSSRLLIIHGKGSKERVVPISDNLAATLLDREPGWLFSGRIDGHLSAGYVSKLISRAMGGLGTAHPLRHRAATGWLESSGGNLRVVQELLGHSSIATTQIYTLVQDSQLRDAVMRRAA